MKKMMSMIFLLAITSNVVAYSEEDWRVYEECKALVYEGKESELDYMACKEMLEHKSALRKYGASSSYRYWIKRLYGE